MVRVKAYELRTKNKGELLKQLEELKNELAQLRVAKVTGGAASKLAKIGAVRKSIARVLTVYNQTQKGKLREVYAGKKHLPKDLRPKKTRALRRALTKEERNAMKKREADLDFSTGDTVEPILDAYNGYANETCALMYQPLLICIMMLFRDPFQLPENYGIKEQDMFYYLLFALVLPFFQIVADVFLHSVLELYHGWKIYDYLVYTRYRFLQRETIWKGLEDSLDECIDEAMRTMDQMCFSSQYYMMMTIYVNGMMLFIFGMQMMLQAQYNFIGDLVAIFIGLFVVGMCVLTEWGLMAAGQYVKLWQTKHENTNWHTNLNEEDEFDVPGWEDMKGASHDQFLMNQRITSETFRYKFLNYNKAWLISQLRTILTPRTLRRSRPYLVNQFTRILNQLNQDISDDSDDGGQMFPGCPWPRNPCTHAFNAPSRTLVRWWLAQARRRMKLRAVVAQLIEIGRAHV